MTSTPSSGVHVDGIEWGVLRCGAYDRVVADDPEDVRCGREWATPSCQGKAEVIRLRLPETRVRDHFRQVVDAEFIDADLVLSIDASNVTFANAQCVAGRQI